MTSYFISNPKPRPARSIFTHLRSCVPMCAYYTDAAIKSDSNLLTIINNHIQFAKSIWEPVGMYLDFQKPQPLIGLDDKITDPSSDNQIKSLPRFNCNDPIAIYYVNASNFVNTTTG